MRALLGLVVLAGSALAESRPAYDLRFVVDTKARTVSGSAKIAFHNTSKVALDEILLWRYPERFAARPAALNDFNLNWIYPYAFNPGGMETSKVQVNGRAVTPQVMDHERAGKGTLLRVPLATPLEPGGKTEIALEFKTRIPKRYGGFGCHRMSCILGGGFYPMLPRLGEEGFDLAAPPARADFTAEVRVPRPSDVIAHGELHPLAPHLPLRIARSNESALALMVSRPKYRAFVREHHGVRIELLSPEKPGLQFLNFQPPHRAPQILDTVATALDLLSELGHPIPAGQVIRLVDGDLRLEPASALPGFVLVSDRLYDIFPIRKFVKFHQFELVRAVFENYVRERVATREDARDLAWAPGIAASYLVDLFTLREHRRQEFARQILIWGSFVPAIDRIIYAPQVQFAGAYFNEDSDPFRDSLWQFSNDLPPGKTPYYKLRDLLGDAAMMRVAKAQLTGGSIRAAVQLERDEIMDWFWKQWLGPYPFVNYRITKLRSERTQKGWLHLVTVEKQGPGKPPVEPVEIRIKDWKRKSVDGRWDGVGKEHLFALETEGRLREVELDPRGRLRESLPADDIHYRYDNIRPARWRFVVNDPGIAINFQQLGETQLALSLDFTLAPQWNVHHSMRFRFYSDPRTDFGTSFNYSYGFGRKILPARLSSAVSTSVSYARLDPLYGQELLGPGNTPMPQPGNTIGAGLGVGYSNQLYAWLPVKYIEGGASGSYLLTLLDNGTVMSQASVSGFISALIPIADGHGLYIDANAAATFGDIRTPRQLMSAGLAAYLGQETLGRARIGGHLEYRHVFTMDLNINLFRVLNLRGLGGGLFVEAAAMSECESYNFTSQGLFYDVGYALRFFGEWFGASQTTFNLQISTPLVRQDRTCFGSPTLHSQPVSVGFAFAPL